MKIFTRKSGQKPQHPIRWLTYKARIKQDVEDAFAIKGAKDVFDEKYVSTLRETIKTLDGWGLRILSVQAAIYLFLVTSLYRDPSKPATAATIFGVPVEAREIVFAISAILAVISWLIYGSRDIRIWIVEQIVELQTPKEFSELKKNR